MLISSNYKNNEHILWWRVCSAFRILIRKQPSEKVLSFAKVELLTEKREVVGLHVIYKTIAYAYIDCKDRGWEEVPSFEEACVHSLCHTIAHWDIVYLVLEAPVAPSIDWMIEINV